MPIILQIDEKSFWEFESILAVIPNGARTVMARAINRVLPSARAQATREIRKELPLPVQLINSSYGIKQANEYDLTGWISSKGRPLPLIYFDAQPKTPGTRPKVGVSAVISQSEGRKTYPGSFVAQLKSGHTGIFKRTGKSRLPIRQLMGPSIPSVFSREPARSNIEQYVTERLNREYRHQASYLITQVMK